MVLTRALACSLLLTACGGAALPAEEPPAPTPTATTTTSSSASTSATANAGTVASSAASTPTTSASKGCEGAACYEQGVALAEKGENEKARAAFASGCEGTPSHTKSCTAYALLLAKGEGGPKDEPKAARLSDKTCPDDPAGCLVHGLLARDGLGVPKDEGRAVTDFDKACKGGMKVACGARDELRASASTASGASGSASGGSDATDFTANGMNMEGLEIGTLKCKLGGGGLGLLGAIVIGKSLSARKDAMAKCTKKPIDVTVKWTNAGSTVKDVKVDAADKAVEACVAKALVGAPATVPATCSAVVHLKP